MILQNNTQKCETLTLEFGGHMATVIRPEHPNGKWIWKTEFLYAFDEAERHLTEMGYTRVYYSISNMYGSYRAVRLMHAFHSYVTERFALEKRCILFGFSRGGLYAFNYALSYPEYVCKVYLDAPVLDFSTWPTEPSQIGELCDSYSITPECIDGFKDNPIKNLGEFFSHRIPLLLIAGDADEVVPFEKNSGALIDYCRDNGIELDYIVKPGCKHHPHSLGESCDAIIDFVEK